MVLGMWLFKQIIGTGLRELCAIHTGVEWGGSLDLMKIFLLFLSHDLRDSLAPKAGLPKASVGLQMGLVAKRGELPCCTTLAAKPCFLPVSYRLVQSTALTHTISTGRHLPGKTHWCWKSICTKLWLRQAFLTAPAFYNFVVRGRGRH